MKISKRRKIAKNAQTGLDTFSRNEKHGRGRPEKIPRSWVIGRANNSRTSLAYVWSRLAPQLLAAQTEEEVKVALETYGQAYARDLVSQAGDVLALIHDPHFPKKPKAQIGFLSDSLAGRPNVEFRTSRDICSKERTKQRAKSPYKILRKEFYIECECGFKGPARDSACRKCGATIPPSFGALGLF